MIQFKILFRLNQRLFHQKSYAKLSNNHSNETPDHGKSFVKFFTKKDVLNYSAFQIKSTFAQKLN